MLCIRSYRTVTAVLALVAVAVPTSAAAAAKDVTVIEVVKRADYEALEELLRSGVDVDEAEPDGTTALHWAAHRGDLETSTRLIAAGANLAATNRYGIAPLWLAAESGHVDIVEALLRASVDPNTSRGESRETVLMIAARAGQTPVIQRLIAYDADVNRQDRVRDQTALMWAAAEGHPDVVRLLAEAGAELEVRSSTGVTPLMFAIRSGDLDTTRQMLDQGANLQETGPDGTPMLVLAILNAHFELAEFLLERGADPNGGDSVHGRPLQVLTIVRRAENRGLSPVLPRTPTGGIDSIDLAEALLEYGADINDRIDWQSPMHVPPHISLSYTLGISYTGATPFFIASKNCDVEFLKFLVANGADPYVGSAQNVTPLLAAAGVGYAAGEAAGTNDEAFETVKFLHRLGDDVSAIADFSGGAAEFSRGSWSGASALHGASNRGATEMVRWLIEQGVPLDHEMNSGHTALNVAEGSNLGFIAQIQPEVAEILRAALEEQGLPVPEPAVSERSR